MKNALLIFAVLLALPFTDSTAFANKAIHDLMEDEVGPAFKIIGTDMRLGKITAQTKQAGKSLLNAFTALQSEVPDFAVDAAGVKRAITPEEIATFAKMNSDMLDLVTILVTQLDSDDLAGAQSTVKQIAVLRGEAHELFKPE